MTMIKGMPQFKGRAPSLANEHAGSFPAAVVPIIEAAPPVPVPAGPVVLPSAPEDKTVAAEAAVEFVPAVADSQDQIDSVTGTEEDVAAVLVRKREKSEDPEYWEDGRVKYLRPSNANHGVATGHVVPMGALVMAVDLLAFQNWCLNQTPKISVQSAFSKIIAEFFHEKGIGEFVDIPARRDLRDPRNKTKPKTRRAR